MWAESLTNLTAGGPGEGGKANRQQRSAFTVHLSREQRHSLLLIVLPLTSNSDLIVSSATISRLFVYTTSNIDRSQISRRQAKLFLTIRAMTIACGRSKRPGVLSSISLVRMFVCYADLSGTTVFAEESLRAAQPISLVRMRVCFAELLGTTVFAEKHPRATWLVSLGRNDSFVALLLVISTNARECAATEPCISMVSVIVIRTTTNRRSVLDTQVPTSYGRRLNGLKEYS